MMSIQIGWPLRLILGLKCNVHKMETPVKIKIEKASGCLTEDRMYLHVSVLLKAFLAGLDELTLCIHS
jgi:hypothetical protein